MFVENPRRVGLPGRWGRGGGGAMGPGGQVQLLHPEQAMFQPNGPAEVQCEFFGPISGLNFGR